MLTEWRGCPLADRSPDAGRNSVNRANRLVPEFPDLTLTPREGRTWTHEQLLQRL